MTWMTPFDAGASAVETVDRSGNDVVDKDRGELLLVLEQGLDRLGGDGGADEVLGCRDRMGSGLRGRSDDERERDGLELHVRSS